VYTGEYILGIMYEWVIDWVVCSSHTIPIGKSPPLNTRAVTCSDWNCCENVEFNQRLIKKLAWEEYVGNNDYICTHNMSKHVIIISRLKIFIPYNNITHYHHFYWYLFMLHFTSYKQCWQVYDTMSKPWINSGFMAIYDSIINYQKHNLFNIKYWHSQYKIYFK